MSTLTEPQCALEVYIGYYWPRFGREGDTEGGIRVKTMFGLLCCYYCALTWIVFDHVLTLHDEVIYVWKRPMRAGSVLFYIVRYLGILSLLAGIAILLWPELEYISPRYPTGVVTRDSEGSCGYPTLYTQFLVGQAEEIAFRSVPALQFSVFWVVEVILQTRIFALYANTRLALVNALIFVLEIVGMIKLWQDAYGLRMLLPTHRIDPSLGYTSSYTAFYWLPGIVFELWLAALAFRKLRPQVLKHDLLSVIVHDSIRYFFLIAIVMVAHIVAPVIHLGPYVVPFVIAGQTIGGSRLVLHLRRAYFRTHDFEASKPSGISFAARQTTGHPVPRSRFADETFYVQDNPSDDEFMEEAL